MTTISNLPDLASPYALPDDVIQSFRTEGHCCLKGVAGPDEAAAYRDVIVQAAEASGQQDDRPLAERDTYGKAFQQLMNLWTRDEAVKRFVLAERFGQIAAELMGVDGVRVYHDQALFKEPGGGITPWHQDQYYWPVDTDNTVTMWMPLVDLTAEMGMLTFASRSHNTGYLGTLPISDESEEQFNEYIREQGMEVHRAPSMKAGDATFHYGWNLHSAPGNAGDRMREVMTIIWVADGCRVTEPINDNQKRDITRWMTGLKPGDLVASELNPLAYTK